MADMSIQFRPLASWTGKKAEYRSSPFQSGHQDTVARLKYELGRLDARNPVIQIMASERDIRRDGLLRADAFVSHPGVILSFEKQQGGRWVPVQFPCATFVRWTDNLRAIALGLEALRKIDRYGITSNGEQYRGWAQLPGAIITPVKMTVDEAAVFVAATAAPLVEQITDPDTRLQAKTAGARAILTSNELFQALYRLAAKQLHPDANGGQQMPDWLKLQEAAEALRVHHRAKEGQQA